MRTDRQHEYDNTLFYELPEKEKRRLLKAYYLHKPIQYRNFITWEWKEFNIKYKLLYWRRIYRIKPTNT